MIVMARNGLAVAVTLYRSGTLTLEQAATRAGHEVSEFQKQIERYGPTAPTV
jgi:Uncharacterised protein family (UPF0175).